MNGKCSSDPLWSMVRRPYHNLTFPIDGINFHLRGFIPRHHP